MLFRNLALLLIFQGFFCCKPEALVVKTNNNKEIKAYPFAKAVGITLYKKPLSSSFFFETGMAIDADGSPRAYHPKNEVGLDDIKHAGYTGNWWALYTNEHGEPVKQGPKDPAPGYYVSMTALYDPAISPSDPNRYVDAEKIPYVVLSNKMMEKTGAVLGDFAAIYNKKTDKLAFAIFADIGPDDKLGEGSIALANLLEIDANPRTGGIEDGVIYLFFIGSGNGEKRSLNEINQYGKKLFEDWGGKELLKGFLKNKV